MKNNKDKSGTWDVIKGIAWLLIPLIVLYLLFTFF